MVRKMKQVTSKKFKSITVSGNVPLERYTELFNYFITPFAMSGNKIEIEVNFKIKSIYQAAQLTKANNNTNQQKKQQNS
jgi:hypothetical protein